MDLVKTRFFFALPSDVVFRTAESPVYFTFVSMTSIVCLHHASFPDGDGIPRVCSALIFYNAITVKVKFEDQADNGSFFRVDNEAALRIVHLPVAFAIIKRGSACHGALSDTPLYTIAPDCIKCSAAIS